MSTQETENTVKVLASAKLTEPQVQTALLEFLLKNEEFKDMIVGKGIAVSTQWQTSKWSDPDALVHIFVTENSTSVQEEAETSSDEEEGEAPSVVTETAATPTQFFKESF